MEITTKAQAFEILDTQPYDIPYSAIDFLYNHPTNQEISTKIITALGLTYTEHYYVKDLETILYTPLWYMIVAEKYLELDILDAIIRVISVEDGDSDLIDEQVSFLTGAICEKHGDLAVEKVLNAIEELMDKKSEAPYLFLFDSLAYADEKTHFDQILRLLEHPNNHYLEPLVFRLSDNQYTSFLPPLKKIITRLKRRKNSNAYLEFQIDTLEESVEELETGELIDPEEALPSHKTRDDWKEYFGKFEDYFSKETSGKNLFYDDDYDDFFPSNHFIHENTGTIKNTKKIGRNEPCPCGSGKKYKKCCLKN